MPDEFEVVLTRAPTRPIDVFVFAPLPTPSARERGQQMFYVSIDGVVPADQPTVGGSSVTLRFDSTNWFTPQTVKVHADSVVFDDKSPEILPIATRPEIDDSTDGLPPRPFIYDDEAFEGVRFGVVNISVKASVVEDQGTVLDLSTNRKILTINAADLGSFDATTIIGQNLQIKAGPAMGQNRFIAGYELDGSHAHLTLDRDYSPDEFPTTESTWLIQDDDSLVGVMDSFREDTAALIDEGIIPQITDPNDKRSIFVDADGAFMTDAQGKGLVGAVLEIVAGAGLGQQRLIVGHGLDDPDTTLILNGGWRTNPDATSVYRIERYDGLALPSISVQVNDNDRPGLKVDETRGFEGDGDADDEASEVGQDYDTITTVIEGGDGDHLGEKDVLRVGLSTDPDGTVEVGLLYDATQFEVRTLDGTLISNAMGQRLTFNDLTTQDLVVTALVDGLREGFHTSLISFELHSSIVDVDEEATEHFRTFTDFPVFYLGLQDAPDPTQTITVEANGIELTRVLTPDANGLFVGGDYFVADNNIVFVDVTGDPIVREGLIDVSYTFIRRGFDGAFTQPVLARIHDLEAPTVIVRETGGSTDVIEVNQTDLSNPNFIPPVSTEIPPWQDSYQLVLSAAPTDDVVVTVTPDISKTTRTGGIRHDDVQVELFSSDSRAVLREFTADATGGSSTKLLDEHATFISDGVKIGTLVRTVTGDWVHVLDVLSETELRTENAGASWNGQGYTFGNWEVRFTDADWDAPVEFQVRAIDDDQVDGGDTQVFKPGPATLSGILGPVVLEGAGGAGSLSLGVPVMLPGETNLRAPNGTVAGFSLGTGFGATEFMTVYAEDLQAFLAADNAEGNALQTLDDLIGLTIEMARGQGLGVVLNPARPNEVFDRFWLIEGYTVQGDLVVLELKNPSQIDPSTLAPTNVPTADPAGRSLVDIAGEPAQAYAITALSANFFVEETVQVDVVFVNDQDSLADSSGVLTATRLYGLNMGPDLVIGGQLRPGGITYDDFEVIEVNLGKGNNNLEVLGTHSREDGYQSWTLINSGDETVAFDAQMGDEVVLHLNAEDEVFNGTVDSAQNANLNLGILTTTIILGESYADGALQGALIRIGQLGGTDTDATGQVRRILNNTGFVITVDRAWDSLPGGESYTITNEADGPIAVNLQAGDDKLDASDSDLGIVAFGGLGADALIGGLGDDILFGDRGRVDYFNEIGAIVTRLGYAPEPITGFVTKQVAQAPVAGEDPLNQLTDTGPKLSGGEPIGGLFPAPDTDGNAQAGTEDIGLKGLYVDINNGFGFLQEVKLIGNNNGTSLFLAESFDPDADLPGPVLGDPAEYRISTIPEDQTDGVVRDPTLLITVDNHLGGGDTITAGGGKDTVFGGAGGDTINVGTEDDIVVGDAGRLDRERDPASTDELVAFLPRAAAAPEVRSYVDRLRTIAFADGGVDVITAGSGADVVLGGFAGDTISGGTGDDILIGDNGEVDYLVAPGICGIVSHVFTTDSAQNTGGADNISGEAGKDIVLGGLNGSPDLLSGGVGDDILLGDNGELVYDDPTDPSLATLDIIRSFTDGLGGADVVSGDAGSDIILGGTGGDLLYGDNATGSNGSDLRDYMLGDNGELLLGNNVITVIQTTDTTEGTGGGDTMRGNAASDHMLGGVGADTMGGDEANDVILGDQGILVYNLVGFPYDGNPANARPRSHQGYPSRRWRYDRR